ncbi:hypothetical protein [Streptomyces sp. URMC 123]|uniref:hypothetical protein n=1 Tax=Streptomyces sp. URMC 123 TaxID=3423403 RepID=UPI003F1C47BB
MPAVAGLSGGSAGAVARFEADEGLGDGDVARAFALWARAVRGPAHTLRSGDDDCGVDACCHPHLAARDLLETAVLRLPSRAARELRALVRPHDEIYESRSLADPGAPASERWWRRRFVP